MVAAAHAGRPFYAFTGAGISTDSGLPDFRSAQGMWQDKEAENASSQWGFDEDPSRVWAMYVEPMAHAKLDPNPGHRSLADLVGMGLISRVVTQNVDSLHELAGVDSSLVDHLHGDLERAECHSCLRSWPMSERVEEWVGERRVPVCDECGGPLQPSLTLFGQQLPQRTWRRAEQTARKAGGVLVLGSSLTVTPAADLPRLTGQLGGSVAIINRGETEMDNSLDEAFDFRFDASISDTLQQLAGICRALQRQIDDQ
jgi:NAD-dependent deacetylase